MMADGTQHNHKNNSSPIFNRSGTISSFADTASELSNKPLFNAPDSPALHRNGSIKSLYGSSFNSMAPAGSSLKGKVRKLCSIFETPKFPSILSSSQSIPLPSPAHIKPAKLLLSSSDYSDAVSKSIPPVSESPFRLPGTEDRVVIYFTSLRGIRKTFQDCHGVRMIFRGFRVNIDERDISMDVAYRKELQKVLGECSVSLPQVFIKGKYIGGADVIMQLLESGDLLRLTNGLPLRGFESCEICDDMRFIPCMNCYGSRKVFDEDEEHNKRCPECNENGLMRCPLCCS